MIKIPRKLITRKIGRKLTICEEEFLSTFYYYMSMKMYRCADILMFQYLYYNMGNNLKDINNEVSECGFWKIIMFLAHKEDYSSVLYLLEKPEGINYFDGAVTNLNIKQLSILASKNKDYKTLYQVCGAYSDTAVLNIPNLMLSIPVLSYNDQFVILRLANNLEIL